MLYGAMNFPVRPVMDEIEEIANLGFDYLELAMDPPEAHYSVIRKNRNLIVKALNIHSLQLVCHLPTFVSAADLTDSIRKASLKETLASLEVAAELAALKVVLHPGHAGGLGIFVMETVLQFALESLEAIIAKGNQLGICICLENMFPRHQLFFKPDNFSEIFEKYPNLKLTFDTGHANIDGRNGQRILDFLNRFGRQIGHIHISDNLGKRDDHLPIGAGTIDFPQVARAIKNCGYDDTITFEIFTEDRRFLQASKKKFAAMLAEG
jgi:sugar phosphate isomerase/epimerase